MNQVYRLLALLLLVVLIMPAVNANAQSDTNLSNEYENEAIGVSFQTPDDWIIVDEFYDKKIAPYVAIANSEQAMQNTFVESGDLFIEVWVTNPEDFATAVLLDASAEPFGGTVDAEDLEEAIRTQVFDPDAEGVEFSDSEDFEDGIYEDSFTFDIQLNDIGIILVGMLTDEGDIVMVLASAPNDEIDDHREMVTAFAQTIEYIEATPDYTYYENTFTDADLSFTFEYPDDFLFRVIDEQIIEFADSDATFATETVTGNEFRGSLQVTSVSELESLYDIQFSDDDFAGFAENIATSLYPDIPIFDTYDIEIDNGQALRKDLFSDGVLTNVIVVLLPYNDTIYIASAEQSPSSSRLLNNILINMLSTIEVIEVTN